ncbi:MAG TPA: riboflavin synthase [Thermodesulfobacteriota bacterium]|nr:riboflavin synthase [Thermodesulfobacteriota bacterium]
MFTGIVEDTGVVKSVDKRDGESTFTISVGKMDLGEAALGDSIAVNGACLTVTTLGGNEFTVDASHETLSRTTLGAIAPGSRVNLERALKSGDRLGGHIVNGHVDGVGEVVSKTKSGGSYVFRFSIPEELAKYVVEKGSVAVDGVSLTVNSAEGSEFTVNIIPFTLAETTFGGLGPGSRVNIECDIIAKYVEKLSTGARGQNSVYQPSDD